MGFFVKILLPVCVSLIIHGGLFGVLLIGWQGEAPKKRIVPPRYIEAKLVQLENKSKKKATAKKKPKKIDLTAKRKEQARLKREAEKKRQAKIRADKKAADKKAKAEKEKAKQLAQQKQKDDERRERENKQRLQQEFEQALLEEQGLLQEEEFATEAQSFASKFRQRVESQWSRPPSARTGMSCELSIQLVPTGRIVSVNVTKSSGSAAFDRSAVQAVKKVEVFPEAKEMSSDVFERYYRNFKFLFNPQDLRL